MERKTVTLALLATLIILVADKGLHGQIPKPRILIALTVAYIFIGFMAEFSPELAASFAVLIFVGVLLSHGVNVFNSLSKTIH